MLLALLEIYEFLPEEKSFLSFQKNLKTRKAVEHNLGIIARHFFKIRNHTYFYKG